MGLDRVIDAMTAGAEAKSISRKINCLDKDPAVETLLNWSLAEKNAADTGGVEQAFVTALAALGLTITGGFHRSPAGGKVLDKLRFIFKSYGIDNELWEWTLKHAHLTKHDFIGLLSVLLYQTGQAPNPLEPILRQKVRIVHVR